MKSKKKPPPNPLICILVLCHLYYLNLFTLFPTGQMQKVLHFSSTYDLLSSPKIHCGVIACRFIAQSAL